MKKFFKLISMLLSVVMILGALVTLFTVGVFAAETDTETGTQTEGTTTGNLTESVDYLNQYFATPDEKLATMTVAYEKDGIRLYIDKTSGEVAYVNTKTGEKLFTNPYDIAASTGNEATKYEILSQIIVTFTDSTGQERVFTSYEEASERGQILVENIKGGIRVEYTIGREQSKILVPRLISMERFDEMILAPLLEVFGDELYNPRSSNPEVFEVQKMLSYYMIYSVDKLSLSSKDRENIENTFGGLYDNLESSDAQYARALKKFPIVDTMDVYVFDPDASEKELTSAEAIITKYCPNYTYEELEYDHILTEYKADDANPPVFRMALEYKADAEGLSVRLPANGIRFNESLYTLEHLEVLPYMGAGSCAYEGYNFFPDGSGTLFDFQSLNTNQTRAVSGKVYGTDFAYHEITGTYQKTIRYPVFGLVEEARYYTYSKYDNETGEKVSEYKIAGNIVDAVKAYRNGESVTFCNGQEAKLDETFGSQITASQTIEAESVEKRGFVCIIEEGDALASITTYHAGALSDYNTIKMQFTPRPKDSYDISDSISVSENSEWTVVSDRKYVGNYTMRYIPLSDPKVNEGAYDASWFGMAVAYRDYLTAKNVISKLSEDELTSDIPLYIESFGAMETTEKILSIPVTVMAPLTTFDNIETMYEELAEQGMKNINFKLTGYANGGMKYTMPGKLKFERVVGGKKGFQALLDKANSVNEEEDSNFGVFPDFDFAYTMNSAMFDGHRPAKHNAQTIDGRYASKKQYSATQQKYENYFEMVISPAYFSHFYEKLTKKFNKNYDGMIGISVSTLGNALNSDFDEDEPYNREDSKGFTVEAFQYFDKNYGQVMTDGGNAYVWKYVDHILGVSLDSSRYNFASEAVPFIGVVLHGSIRFAGDPLNMEGDINYALLKAIENGASPYFVLSYQNTQILKEDKLLSKYYSIRYDIWKDDIIDSYSVLNNILSDVQDKYITGHQFLEGATRVPDMDELMSDILGEYDSILEAQKNAAELLQKELERAANIARENGRVAEKYAAEAVISVLALYNSQMKFVNNSAMMSSEFYGRVKEAYGHYYQVISLKGSKDPTEKEKYDRISAIYDIVTMFDDWDYESALTTYNLEYAKYKTKLVGADYKSYNKMVKDAYTAYANAKLAYAQIKYEIAGNVAEDKLDEAISMFKEGQIDEAALIAVIEKYGAILVDTGDLDNAIRLYINNTLDTETLANAAEAWSKDKNKETDKTTEEAFNAALEAYINGTLADIALTDAANSWFDSLTVNGDLAALQDALAAYVAGGKKTDLEKAIAAYCAAKLDKAELQSRIADLITAKNAYDDVEDNYVLDAFADPAVEFAAAETAYNEALAAFDAALVTFKEKFKTGTYEKAIATFEEAKTAYEEAVARKNIDKTNAEANYLYAKLDYEAAQDIAAGYIVTAMDAAAVEADFNEYERKSTAYEEYLAADKAFAAALDSGFKYSYDVSFAIYNAKYSYDRYSSYTKLLQRGGYSNEDYNNYKTYYEADVAVKSFEADIKAAEPESGRFDNYIIALAQYDYVMANKDTVPEADIAKAQSLLTQTRRNAVTNVATIDSATLEEIEAFYKTALEHVALAEAAIEVLALSENYTIQYIAGEEKHLKNILITPDMPFIVREAVERAQTAYDYVVEDKIEVIEDGILTDYYHDGHRLYRTRLASSGETVYFYGTYEAGYQYLTMNDDGSFSVYDKNKSNADGVVNGNIVYENVYGDFGKNVYFTIADGKMTYYVKAAEGIFIEKTPTVYKEEYFRTLDDGTVIYKDGETYYSKNDADGTYTRYTYSKCIKSCYEDALLENERVFGVIEAVQNNPEVSDKTIYDDILKRIAINKLLDQKDEEEEEVVEESKYDTENVVAVTYGNDDGSAYKTIILNYNNYAIRIEYEKIVYTIPAYGFVEIKYGE